LLPGVQHCGLDAICGSAQIVVLPNDDQPPTSIRQRTLIALIAGGVSFELWQPILAIRLGKYRMLWTEVPEASSVLDYDARPRKHDVRPTSEPCHRRVMLPESKAPAMEEGT
jgi:hypothetical protein